MVDSPAKTQDASSQSHGSSFTALCTAISTCILIASQSDLPNLTGILATKLATIAKSAESQSVSTARIADSSCTPEVVFHLATQTIPVCRNGCGGIQICNQRQMRQTGNDWPMIARSVGCAPATDVKIEWQIMDMTFRDGTFNDLTVPMTSDAISTNPKAAVFCDYVQTVRIPEVFYSSNGDKVVMASGVAILRFSDTSGRNYYEAEAVRFFRTAEDRLKVDFLGKAALTKRLGSDKPSVQW